MDQVEEVKSKTDIVALISERVDLKKAGRNYKAVCPFHQEKTPSFMVSPDLQIFKCFGCGESGDAISFLQKYEGLDFYESLKLLADRAGIKLKPFAGPENKQKETLYEINSLSARFYHYILTSHTSGKSALDYVTNTRKLTKETVKTFQIGYAPNSQDVLFKFLQKKGFTTKLIETSGVITTALAKPTDRFRGRVIFPIYNHLGNCIALGGRILPEVEKSLPAHVHVGKYINSPETPVYHKSNSLYGIHITKSDIKKSNTAVVVEGEMDAVSCWQAGVKNIVAIKGTALTSEQIRFLSRVSQTVKLALDTDTAGDSATQKAVVEATNAGLDVQVVILGSYKDPDDFAKADPKGLLKAIESTKDAWEFIIDTVTSKLKISTGAGVAKASQTLAPIIAQVSDEILKAHYAKLLAQKLKISQEAVIQQIQKKSTTKSQDADQKKSANLSHEDRLLYLLLESFEKGLDMPIIKKVFNSVRNKKVLNKALKYKKSTKKFTIADFLKTLPEELNYSLSNTALEVRFESDALTPNLITKEVKDIYKTLLIKNIKAKQEKLVGKLKDKKYQKKFDELSVKRQRLEHEGIDGIIHY